MSPRTSTWCRTLLVAIMLSLLSGGGWAEADKDNQGRWTTPTTSGPDKDVPGFLVNLGPTGVRAILTETTFIVRYVFAGAPADGRIRCDDVITGVAGTPFPSYTFGGATHGYEGPIMSVGEAIERAESGTGSLVFTVQRAGRSIAVTVPLERVGAFSATFPVQCAKSALLQSRALSYLASHPESWQGPAHVRATVALALLTSSVPEQAALGRTIILGWNNVPSADTWTWAVSYQLIALSEYHLLSHDAAVLPTISALCALLRRDQYAGTILVWGPTGDKYLERLDYAKVDAAQQLYAGGFGHTPYIPGMGKDGCGPMQFTTILAVIAWQLAARCGAPVDRAGIASALDFIHRGTNAAGYVAYGGEFTLNAGLVDPLQWKQSTEGSDFVGRAGAALLAHTLSPECALAEQSIALHRRYLKSAYKSLPDGHADPLLGFCWGLLGSAAAQDDSVLRTMMDYHKALFNMMRCADGSFVVLPGRNYADGSYFISSRYYPTAIMALTLGLGNPRLMIQGTQVSVPGVNVKALRGRFQAAYQAIVAKSYPTAIRLLAALRTGTTVSAEERTAGEALMQVIDARLQTAVVALAVLERRGDVAALSTEVQHIRATFGALEQCPALILPIEERLRREPALTQVALGMRFAHLLASLRKYRTAASAQELERFAEKRPEGLYARWAHAVVQAFRETGVVIDPSTLPGEPSPPATSSVPSLSP